jgi:hypothetical protein
MPAFRSNKEARYFERDRYLASYGVEIPIDSSLFIPGSEREHDCVLCSASHIKIPLLKFDILRETYKELDCHVCEECDSLVKQMMAVNYPSLLEEYIHSSNSKEFDANVKILRIKDYKIFGRFPADIHYKYLHLTIDHTWTNSDLGNCIFCNSVVHNPLVLDVPVSDESATLSGGKVNICRSCEFDISTSDIPTDAIAQTCAACRTKYYITSEEHRIRKLKRTLEYHTCPSCTQLHIDGITKDDLYFDVDAYHKAETNSWKAPSRFICKECTSCGTNFQLDRTILPDVAKLSHSVNGKIYCSNCVKLRTFKSNQNKVWLQFNDNTFIVIYKEGKYWAYRIFRTKNYDKPKKVFESAKNISDDCIVTTFIAYEECNNLVNSKQLELWEDQ